MNRFPLALLVFLLSFSLSTAAEKPVPTASKQDKTTKEEKAKDEYAWQSLFDGKTLDGWSVPVFGGDGEVRVEDGVLVIGMGAMITGIKYEKVVPTIDYEIRYEAKRTQGHDFFASLTFPFGESACTFINGGWGGGTTGLSCINGLDASENETGNFHDFSDNIWYRFRVRVTGKRIDVWVEEEVKDGDKKRWKETRLVDLDVEDRKISLRDETSLYRPLGFCTWVTEGAVRDIKVRKLKPEEVDGKTDGKAPSK